MSTKYIRPTITERQERLNKVYAQRDEFREALQALYDACPTGFGNDRALDEALKQAEAVLGVRRDA
jgi:hypothetical protein